MEEENERNQQLKPWRKYKRKTMTAGVSVAQNHWGGRQTSAYDKPYVSYILWQSRHKSRQRWPDPRFNRFVGQTPTPPAPLGAWASWCDTVATFALRTAALLLHPSCYLRMKAYTPSSTRLQQQLAFYDTCLLYTSPSPRDRG